MVTEETAGHPPTLLSTQRLSNDDNDVVIKAHPRSICDIVHMQGAPSSSLGPRRGTASTLSRNRAV